MNVVAPFLFTLLSASAQPKAEQTQLTIYNQNFAVVRQLLSTDLKAGLTTLTRTDVTRTLEPDSVVLRDPTGKRELRVVEQNFRPSALTPETLLERYEGKLLDFEVTEPGGRKRKVTGKVLRSGGAAQYNRYGQIATQAGQPVVEIEGKTRFGLPGIPLFPPLGSEDILKPTLSLVVESAQAGPLGLELAYLTGGMTWEAAYNLIAPETGDTVSLTGLVTVKNRSGKVFPNTQIQLMAGDVSKLRPAGIDEIISSDAENSYIGGFAGGMGGGMMGPPPVTQKTFDEYHLYSLSRKTTLQDGETKQVEFVRSEAIDSERIYVYNGAWIDPNRYRGWGYENIRSSREFGTQSNPKVWVMREFENTEKNHLGIPLPKGRVRFYRKDGDALQFVGENTIDHTPQGEKVRVYTGDAFDNVGERRQTSYSNGPRDNTIDESFEIKVRNRKKEPVTVRVVEKLYRSRNWEIATTSEKFVKKDSNTIEYTVTIPPDGEKTLTYTVHYWW